MHVISFSTIKSKDKIMVNSKMRKWIYVAFWTSDADKVVESSLF